MQRFRGRLVAGKRAPYTSWTFIVVPESVRATWDRKRAEVRGTIGGAPFRGTMARGDGVYRVPVRRELLERIGAERGATVDVALELDDAPREVEVPAELASVLAGETGLRALFDAAAPSLRRAWATYVASAKEPATRSRRAEQAPAGLRSRRYPRQKP